MRLLILSLTCLAACSGPDREPGTTVETREATPSEPSHPPASDDPGEAPVDPDDGESTAPTPCESDDQCEMYAFCCACPRTAEAMHVDEATEMREQCTRVRCAACGIEALPDTRVARCVNAVCTAVEP